MTEGERQLVCIRYMEIKAELTALADGRVVDGNPADLIRAAHISFTLADRMARAVDAVETHDVPVAKLGALRGGTVFSFCSGHFCPFLQCLRHRRRSRSAVQTIASSASDDGSGTGTKQYGTFLPTENSAGCNPAGIVDSFRIDQCPSCTRAIEQCV